jgi:hypothetical protein
LENAELSFLADSDNSAIARCLDAPVILGKTTSSLDSEVNDWFDALETMGGKNKYNYCTQIGN